MGILRKSTSVFTLGAIDYKSDKERIANSTRRGMKATKKSNKLMKKQNKILKNM